MSVVLRGLRIVRDRFTLEIDADLPGRCTAILGPSGSGKTTLLESVAGLVRPAEGRIEIHGTPVSDAALRLFVPPRRRRVGYVPQDGALFPHVTARGNLLYGSRGDDAGAERVLGMLGISDLMDRRIPSLSGGEQRRVALGRALLAGPRLLLLDEPFTGLDRKLRAQAVELVSRVSGELGIPMLLVTHDEDDVASLADTIVRLDGGRRSPDDGAPASPAPREPR